jgi:septal ring factor EnvC (AmiA/AmiB activator)
MSHTNFDAPSFSRSIATPLFAGLATAVLSARAQAQVRADAVATGAALDSWEQLVADQQAEIEALSRANAQLVAALNEQDETMLLLNAEIATLAQRLSDAGAHV